MIDNERSNLNRQISSLKSNISSVSCRISNLGRRPDAELVTRYRTVRVERSCFNPLRWVGDKYTTETQSYKDYDYTKQKDYDAKRRKLDTEKADLNSQLSALRRQIDNLPDLEFELQSIIREKERALKEKEYQLSEVRKEKEAQEKEMAAGREAFLNSRKRTLISMLQSILANEYSDLHCSLKNDSKNCLSQLRGNLIGIIRSYFKEESNNYIKHLNEMLNNISSTLENKEIEHKRNALNISKNKVKNLLAEIEAVTI